MTRAALVRLSLALLGLATCPLRAMADNPDVPASGYLQELIAKADQLALADTPVWRALLHYPDHRLFPARRSSASEDFFLAPHGAQDASAELRATLRRFFSDAELPRREQHPQCAYIARRSWLVEYLDIDPERLPLRACGHYQTWRTGLQARGLTLIYPEGFMNNPASMFGHTLLRIDSSSQAGGEELLGYAVDFTADAGDDGGLGYLFKGVFGLYPGRFGINPYYQQLKRYAEWENRDIWEYRLELTDAELDFMLMHLWELRGIEFPYYFFGENCSHQLLRLLDIARPGLASAAEHPLGVIPVDTVRTLVSRPGLTGDIRYRPAPATRLARDLRRLSPAARRLSQQIARAELQANDPSFADYSAAERARVLSTAYEQVRYELVSGDTTSEVAQRLSREILVARSKLGRTPERGDDEVPTPTVRPDQSHATALIDLSGGTRDSEGFVELRIRPVLHGLLDPEAGYPRHMQIRFFDTRVRYYPTSGKVRLQDLKLLEAISLSPRDAVFRPLAWEFGTGVSTRRVREDGDLEDATVWRSNIGVGLSAAPGPLLLYGLIGADLDVGSRLEDSAAFGPSARLGVYLGSAKDRWKAHFFAASTYYAVGDTTLRVRAGSEQRVRLRRNSALVLDATFNRIAGESWLEAGGRIQLFF